MLFNFVTTSERRHPVGINEIFGWIVGGLIMVLVVAFYTVSIDTPAGKQLAFLVVLSSLLVAHALCGAWWAVGARRHALPHGLLLGLAPGALGQAFILVSFGAIVAKAEGVWSVAMLGLLPGLLAAIPAGLFYERAMGDESKDRGWVVDYCWFGAAFLCQASFLASYWLYYCPRLSIWIDALK